MDSYLYTQVIDRVLSQAICPRCGASVRDSAYDIVSIDENRMILELDCENCASILTINGAFQRKRNTFQRQQGATIVSPETVRGIGQVLKEFRGENIQDLLSK